MQMTEADESLSNYMKCNKLLRFYHAGFQNWKCIFYVVTHLSRSLIIVCFQEIKFRKKWPFVCSFVLSDVSGILTVFFMGRWMRSVVLSVYGAVTRNMKRIIYYGIVRPDLFLPLKELTLLLLCCYWSTKKAGTQSQISRFMQHYWGIHIYQSPAKLSIHMAASSLLGWVGNFAWEYRHIAWQWLLLLSLTLDKTKTNNKFSKLKELLLTKVQLTEIICNIITYNISPSAFKIRI